MSTKLYLEFLLFCLDLYLFAKFEEKKLISTYSQKLGFLHFYYGGSSG